MNKKLIRLTESDLHRIVKESVNRILKETHNEWDELASIRWRNRNYRNNSDEAQRVGKVRGDALANWNKKKKMNEGRIPQYEEPVFIGCNSPEDADVSVEIGYNDYSSSLFYVGGCRTDGYAALAVIVQWLEEHGIINHYAYSEEDLDAYDIEDFVEVEGYYLPSWLIHMHQLTNNHSGRV